MLSEHSTGFEDNIRPSRDEGEVIMSAQIPNFCVVLNKLLFPRDDKHIWINQSATHRQQSAQCKEYVKADIDNKSE